MIKKERPYPLRLKLDEALLRGLSPNHEKRPEILTSIRKNKAGYRGEQELDYHLSFLPKDQFQIFNDLRLPFQNKHFQIDTLLLSQNAIIIIESKNIYGHLFFDSHTKQLIRTFDGQKEGFPDPLLQAERHKVQLLGWLSQHMNKTIPIHVFVSIGHPSTILETQPDNYHIFKKIFHAEHLQNQILMLTNKDDKPQLTPYQIKKISDLLLKEHTPKDISILSTYKVKTSDLIRGVACPQCFNRSMVRIHGKWLCQGCGIKSKSAHEQIIKDYILIHGSITNPQCRALLNINKTHIVKRILAAMNLTYSGQDKNRTYYLPKKESLTSIKP